MAEHLKKMLLLNYEEGINMITEAWGSLVMIIMKKVFTKLWMEIR